MRKPESSFLTASIAWLMSGCKRLNHPSSQVRKRTVQELGEKRSTKAVDSLVACLKDADRYVRKFAAEALGNIKDIRAVEPLMERLSDGEKDIRNSAALALGNIGNARAVDRLIICLKDKDENKDVRENAAVALEKIGSLAVEPLIACLKDKWYVRRLAIEALGKMGDARAVESLLACLKNGFGIERLHAAEALGNVGNSRAVEPLLALLKDRKELCWAAGLSAMHGANMDESAMKSLRFTEEEILEAKTESTHAKTMRQIEVYMQIDKLIEKVVIESLAQIGKPAVGPLMICLEDANAGWDVRRTAAEVLGKIGDERAIETLTVCLKDKNENVRSSAAEALKKLQ